MSFVSRILVPRLAVRALAGLVLTLSVQGCAQFPELEAGETPSVADAPYPKLVPLNTLLDGPVPTATIEVQGQVSGRADGLRARAARLKQMRVGPGQGIGTRAARLRQKAAALRAQ